MFLEAEYGQNKFVGPIVPTIGLVRGMYKVTLELPTQLH